MAIADPEALAPADEVLDFLLSVPTPEPTQERLRYLLNGNRNQSLNDAERAQLEVYLRLEHFGPAPETARPRKTSRSGMTQISEALRREVAARGQSRCEYCRLHEDDAHFTHEIDHIYAEKHCGPTYTDNLCVACTDCNRHKGRATARVTGFNRPDLVADRAQLAQQQAVPVPHFVVSLQCHKALPVKA
jgi:hypothetical protein